MPRYCVVYPLTSWYVVYVDAEDENDAGDVASNSDHGTIVDLEHLPEFVTEPPDESEGCRVIEVPKEAA